MYGLKFLTLAVIARTGEHFFSFPGLGFLSFDAYVPETESCIWSSTIIVSFFIIYAQKLKPPNKRLNDTTQPVCSL